MSRRKSDQENEAAEAETDATLTPSSPYDQGDGMSHAQAESIAGAHPEVGSAEFSRGYKAAQDDAESEARHVRESILLSCVHGVRIHVKDGESPGAVALRVVEIVEKILLRAAEKGLIAAPAQQGEQFKQYEGAEQLNIAKPE